MANNCLFSKLKGAVDNPYLLTMEQFSFIPKSDGTTKYTIGWGNTASHVDLVNSNVNGVTSYDVAAGETPTEKTVTVTGTNPLVKLSKKYNINYLDIRLPESYNVEQLNYSEIKDYVYLKGNGVYGCITDFVKKIGNNGFSGINTEVRFVECNINGDVSGLGGQNGVPKYFRKLYLSGSMPNLYGSLNNLGYTARVLLDVYIDKNNRNLSFDIVEFIKKNRRIHSYDSSSRGVIFTGLNRITTTVDGASTYSFPTNTTIKWTATTITFTTTTGDVTINNSEVEPS